MKALRDHRVWWALAAVAVVASILTTALPLRDWSDAIEDSLEDHSVWVALAIFCAAYVVGTLLMLPAWMFAIAAGAAFGFGRGTLAAMVSSTVAAFCAYLLARHLLRARVERSARRNPSFKAVDAAVQRAPVKVVALLRLAPVLPSGLKSYFLGLTRIEPAPYVIASALGMLPGNAVKAWLGHAGRDALTEGSPAKWALLAVGIAATVAVAVIAGRIARREVGI